jgi:hypothetical protein
VLVILEVVIQDQLRLGRGPDWAREILWAPFMAMTYLMVLHEHRRRKASARPTLLSAAILSIAALISFTVASEWTAQWETSSARAPAQKNARARPDSASAPSGPPGAVLQADRMPQFLTLLFGFAVAMWTYTLLRQDRSARILCA